MMLDRVSDGGPRGLWPVDGLFREKPPGPTNRAVRRRVLPGIPVLLLCTYFSKYMLVELK